MREDDLEEILAEYAEKTWRRLSLKKRQPRRKKNSRRRQSSSPMRKRVYCRKRTKKMSRTPTTRDLPKRTKKTPMHS